MDRDEKPAEEVGPPFPGGTVAQEAWARIQAMDDWVIERQIELTTIPAPPFGEGPRGERVRELFGELGLKQVRTDREGNVLGRWDPENAPVRAEVSETLPLVVSAHLDTVFPAGTDVTPTHDGNRISAPGITDDGRGLGAILALARLVSEHPFPISRPLFFVATVGEEGPGDLRGVRHLFAGGPELGPVSGFISLDGVGLDRIIHRGVGSTRLRIEIDGPGGHSWTDYGRPNPIDALGALVSRAGSFPLPEQPRASMTFARWGGGTSINSIPQKAWVEVDLRSEGAGELESLEGRLMEACREEVEKASKGQPHASRLHLAVKDLGRRPPGATDPSQRLVQAAVEATRRLGEEPQLVSSSTDSNLPMSLGIPAITLGAGGRGGGIHTTDEWFENTKGPEGILRALLTILFLEESGFSVEPGNGPLR